jgi:superfamily I DNA/RNA helicase
VLAEHLDGKRIASLAMRTVSRFCYTADSELGAHHVPWVKGLDARLAPQLAELVAPVAKRAWQDLIQPDGSLGFTHDVYLKLFQLRRPRLPQQTILLDEAQDTNPCVADIVLSQQEAGKQVILVGDPNQAIYEWRGATDAMAGFEAKHRMQLTGSYRFGPRVADEANRWLGLLESTLALKGWKRLNSEVTDGPPANGEEPDATLYRTNAGCITGAMRGLAEGQRVAIAGGGGEIASLARAAADLQSGRTTDHPDLVAFADWEEVRAYVKDEPEDAGQLAPLVRAVDNYGPDVILDMTNRLVPETANPTLTVSTAHKAKGREWGYVRIGDDFPQPKEGKELPREELRLAYVAITRAKNTLERGSLAWIGALPEQEEEDA